MKAAVFLNYGSPEVLQITQLNKPVPNDNEILVKIFATAVNSGDVRLRKADPFAVRFLLGLIKPHINVLGSVFSGRIEAVGKNVKRFHIGDDVFGSTDMRFGAYAEYKCFTENDSIALKPKNLSFEEAAVIPFGGTTALHFLKKATIKPTQNVLIYGASGAVGTAAIQLATYFGANVTAVCSTANKNLVTGLGAKMVIDYTAENFLHNSQNYDVIYDSVNKLPVAASFKKLNKNGILILGAAGMCEILTGKLLSLFSSKKVVVGVTKHTTADIEFLAGLLENNKLKPVIDKVFPLDEIATAHAYVDTGHKKGNVAITV